MGTHGARLEPVVFRRGGILPFLLLGIAAVLASFFAWAWDPVAFGKCGTVGSIVFLAALGGFAAAMAYGAALHWAWRAVITSDALVAGVPWMRRRRIKWDEITQIALRRLRDKHRTYITDLNLWGARGRVRMDLFGVRAADVLLSGVLERAGLELVYAQKSPWGQAEVWIPYDRSRYPSRAHVREAVAATAPPPLSPTMALVLLLALAGGLPLVAFIAREVPPAVRFFLVVALFVLLVATSLLARWQRHRTAKRQRTGLNPSEPEHGHRE